MDVGSTHTSSIFAMSHPVSVGSPTFTRTVLGQVLEPKNAQRVRFREALTELWVDQTTSHCWWSIASIRAVSGRCS
jgi:hypothetical protein